MERNHYIDPGEERRGGVMEGVMEGGRKGKRDRAGRWKGRWDAPNNIRCVLTEQLHQVHSKVEQPSSFYGNNFKQQS